MPFWSSSRAFASSDGRRRGLSPGRRPWWMARVWGSGRDSILNKLVVFPDRVVPACFPSCSCCRGDGGSGEGLQAQLQICRGVSSIWSCCWRTMFCSRFFWSLSSTVIRVEAASTLLWILLAERRHDSDQAYDCRILFFLLAVVPIGRQGVLRRASASSSGASWWHRRGEGVGPSGLVPGFGILGYSLGIQKLKRRATLQSTFSFYGPTGEIQGLVCNFLSYLGPFACCKVDLINT